MLILYGFENGWKAVASFVCDGYADEVRAASARKFAHGKTDAERNAARVLESFVCGARYYPKSYAKTLLRALRHFDEVGISNEIFEALEEAKGEAFERFALGGENADLAAYTSGDTDLRI